MKLSIPSILITTLLAGFTHPAEAAVIYSGLRDITIPTTFEGFYLDLDNGMVRTFETSGWDLNPFFGGAGLAHSPFFQPARVGANESDPVLNMNRGDLIDSSLFFLNDYGGSWNPVPHLGTSPGSFPVGGEAILGFQWTPNGSSNLWYGWMRVTFTNNVPGGQIHDWAYDNTGSGIQAGIVPVP